MKKRFFLALVAFSMSLAGCGRSGDKDKDKEETNLPSGDEGKENGGENGGGNGGENGPAELTPEQKANSAQINTMITTYMTGIVGENAQSVLQPEYYVACSDEAALNGVDPALVSSTIARASQTVFENPLDVFAFLNELRTEGSLDDDIYFAVVFGKSLLKTVIAQYSLMEEEQTEGLPPVDVYTAALDLLEKEGSKLPTNIYAVVNGMLGVYTSATDPAFMMDVSALLRDDQTLSGTNLKKVVNKVSSMITTSILPIEENVKYMAEFVKSAVHAEYKYLLPMLLDAMLEDHSEQKEEDEPEYRVVKKEAEPEEPSLEDMIVTLVEPVFDLIDASAIVGGVFDAVEELIANLNAIPEAYYAHLNEIANPVESYSYAVLGLVEFYADNYEIPVDELVQIPGMILDFAKEMLPEIESFVGEEAIPEFISTILESENTEAIFVKAINLAASIASIRFESVNAIRLASVLGSIYDGIKIRTSNNSSSYEDADEKVQALVATEYGYYAEAYENKDNFYYWDRISNVSDFELLEDETTKSFEVIEIEVYFFVDTYKDGDETYIGYATDELTVETKYVEFTTLQPVADLIYDVLCEIADAKLLTSSFIDQIGSIYSSLLALYNEISEEIAPLFGEDAEATIGEINMAIEWLNAVFSEDGKPLVSKTISDLFAVIRDLFSAFIPEGETPADIDFTEFVVVAVAYKPQFEDLMNSFASEKLSSIPALLADIYDVANLLGLAETVIALLAQLEVGEDVPMFPGIDSVKSGDEFANCFMPMIESMLAIPAEVE